MKTNSPVRESAAPVVPDRWTTDGWMSEWMNRRLDERVGWWVEGWKGKLYGWKDGWVKYINGIGYLN